MIRQKFFALFSGDVGLIRQLLLGLGVFFLFQKLAMYFTFQLYYDDLFYYDRSVWEILVGKGAYIQGEWRDWPGLLVHIGNHFSPYLIPIAGLYALLPTPVWLFLIHTIAVLLVAYPILRVAGLELGRKGISIAFLMLLYYFSFRTMNLIDFKGDVFAGVAITWAAYFLYKDRLKAAVIVALLALLFKENAFLLVMGFALFLMVVKRRYMLGAAVALFALAVGYYLVAVFIPHYSYFDYFFLNYYGYLGDGFSEIIVGIFTKPWVVLANLFTTQKMVFVFVMFAPLLFLPFLSPYLLLSSGIFVQNLLSNNVINQDITYHHSASVVGVILFSAVLGLAKVLKGRDEVGQRQFWRRASWVIGFFVVLNGLYFLIFETRPFYKTHGLSEAYEAMAMIPERASVSASSTYTVHLTYRDTVSLFPNRNNEDYVFVEGIDPFYPADSSTHVDVVKQRWADGDYGAVILALLRGVRNYSPVKSMAYAAALDDLWQDPNYDCVYNKDTVLLFKRRGI